MTVAFFFITNMQVEIGLFTFELYNFLIPIRIFLIQNLPQNNLISQKVFNVLPKGAGCVKMSSSTDRLLAMYCKFLFLRLLFVYVRI